MESWNFPMKVILGIEVKKNGRRYKAQGARDKEQVVLCRDTDSRIVNFIAIKILRIEAIINC